MQKINWKKQDKALYSPSSKIFNLIDVPAMQFLMIDGCGDPNTAPAYREAVQTLYKISYSIKFASKNAGKLDWVIAPLEGLWWAEQMQEFSLDSKDEWLWTMMIRQPDDVNIEDVQSAVEAKGEALDPSGLRLERLQEGMSVQILHLGPYEAEAPTIVRMHAFIRENGCQPSGKHHEIYISDPNRTAPKKLKTVLRQPVQQA